MAAAACCALTACSGGQSAASWQQTQTADQIFASATQSRSQLNSEDIVVHRPGSGAPVAELAFAAPGALRVLGNLDVGRLEAIVVHGHVYIRAPQLWRQILGVSSQDSPVMQRIDDHWVDVTSAGTTLLPGLGEVISSNLLQDCLVMGPHGQLRKGPDSTVNGYQAIELSDSGNAPGSVPGRWYVATAAPHFFLRFVATGNRTPGGNGPPGLPQRCRSLGSAGVNLGTAVSTSGMQVDFLEINKPVLVAAPPGPLDISSLTP